MFTPEQEARIRRIAKEEAVKATQTQVKVVALNDSSTRFFFDVEGSFHVQSTGHATI